MYRKLAKTTPISLGFLGIDLGFDDKDYVSPDKKALEEYHKQRMALTPIERLKRIYSMNEYGELSPELNSIRQAAFFGGFVGVMYGGFVDSRISYMNFMERNQATAFENHFEAKKTLQNNVTTGFARGAWKWGWRLCLFTTSYTAITTTIAAYRGKSSLWEYMAAGGCTGALYKFNMGLKGMTAGGVVGGFLGGIAGLFTLGLLKLTGRTMEDVQYWQNKWQVQRRQIEKEAWAIDQGYTPNPLEMNHTLRVGTENLTLDTLDAELAKLEDAERRQTNESSKKDENKK